MSLHAKAKAGSHEHWCTPRHVVERLLLLGPIGLDPCSNERSIVPAAMRWTADHGIASLTSSWEPAGNWYCNPPYGRGIAAWTAKVAHEGRRCGPSGIHGVAMVPANTGSSWFREHIASATEILFWGPRVKFDDAGGRLKPSIDVCSPYWGRNPRLFRDAFAGCGWFRSAA